MGCFYKSGVSCVHNSTLRRRPKYYLFFIQILSYKWISLCSHTIWFFFAQHFHLFINIHLVKLLGISRQRSSYCTPETRQEITLGSVPRVVPFSVFIVNSIHIFYPPRSPAITLKNDLTFTCLMKANCWNQSSRMFICRVDFVNTLDLWGESVLGRYSSFRNIGQNQINLLIYDTSKFLGL